ncbi:MAG: UDP-N-acetylmuramoyl-tripeptide--D-alanyl-D-alanine ligase [Chloroflexi bacterium]|nr:UDP-N-acetylmuramoyl-tripeptide--D-alanyl-D-alanine ligase [Chloroflexota bacterium]
MFTLDDLLQASQGALHGAASAGARLEGVAIDSRQVQPNNLFVALRGQKHDGHDFVAQAFARGAGCAVVERIPADCPWALEEGGDGPPLVVVPDSLAALQALARSWRRRHGAMVVGVTGSVGKTTTKETIASVLSGRFGVLKSQGNLNTEIGIPMILMQLTERHQVAVLEMGMNAVGEIRLLADIAQPQVGVVTNVQPSHLERLGTIERIAQAKRELVEALPPHGLAVLNADDPWVRAMAERSPAPVRLYGLSAEAEVWASTIMSQGLRGVEFELHYGRDSVHVKLPLLGIHSVHAALAAATVALRQGLELAEIAQALREMAASVRIIVLAGIAGSRLIDDTYNANPESTLAALNLLSELEGRKIAVLGDMLELGSYEATGHRKVGSRAALVVDGLVAIGSRAALVAEAAREAGLPADRVFHTHSNGEAIEHLRRKLRPGDNVLVKGSRGMRMEEIVQALAVEED